MTTASARLVVDLASAMEPDAPLSGPIRGNLNNANKGTAWTDGGGSGQIEQAFEQNYTIGAAATQAFNTLAAGALTDLAGDTVDLDELKYLVIKVNTGTVELTAPGANFIGLFKAAADALVLPVGTYAFDLGAAGIDVTVNSLFNLVDTGAGSTVTVAFGGAA
jgi:hypothetical protein|tara:strand:- start:40 stop:528 length:489 start_codon:yes stop_codon:yes gene_type:complete